MKFSIQFLFVGIMLFFVGNTALAQQEMPDINVKTLEGKTVSIKSLVGKGHPVLITFWATWCTPCKKEMDAINDVYPDWKEDYGLEVIAITIDNIRALSKVKPMVAQKGWEFQVLSDSKQTLQTALNFQTIPQSFLLDGKGHIVYSHNGYAPGDEYHLEDEIKKL